jgi:transcription initiation factor TFIID subunit 6
MILETFRLPPVLGYTLTSSTETMGISGDGAELSVVLDPEVSLADVATARPNPTVREIPFSFNWLLIDGINIEPRSARRGLKMLDRPSTLATPPSDHRIFGDSGDPPLSIGDTLAADFRRYFEHAIELVYDDSQECQAALLDSLRTDAGIQPLLPLFLQFLAERLTSAVNDTDTVGRVARLAMALLENLSLPVQFYAHSFIRVVMTVLLRYESGEDVDEDIDTRRLGSRLLQQVCERCVSGFPRIRTVALNALIQGWFDPLTTHAAQLGALIGIEGFGNAGVRQVAGHFGGSLAALKRELALGDDRKVVFIVMILGEMEGILSQNIDGMSRDEANRAQAALADVIATRKALDGG